MCLVLGWRYWWVVAGVVGVVGLAEECWWSFVLRASMLVLAVVRYHWYWLDLSWMVVLIRYQNPNGLGGHLSAPLWFDCLVLVEGTGKDLQVKGRVCHGVGKWS